jgi:hypothetical protein
VKEPTIRVRRNDDPAPVAMDDAQRAAALKVTHELICTAGELHSAMKDNRLTQGYRDTLCGCIEFHVTDVLKALGYDATLVREMEERYAEVRAKNDEIRALRAQLGAKVSSEDVREKLKVLYDLVYRWWADEGFGHASQITFGQYGCKVAFSGLLTRSRSADDGLAAVVAKGYHIYSESPYSHEVVCDDHNMALLKAEVIARFPSAELLAFTAHHNHEGVSTLRDAEFIIRELTDIDNTERTME